MLILACFLLLVTEETDVDKTTHRNVVGYISVRFTPEVLRVSQGDTVTGHVHVAVQSHNSVYRRPSQPSLRACVVDQSVTTVSWSTVDTDHRTDLGACSLLPSVYVWESTDRPEVAAIYLVQVRGVLIGRSAVRFYVIKTQTGSSTGAGSRHNQTVGLHTGSNNGDLVVTPEDHVTSQNHVTTAQVVDQTATQSNANVVRDDESYGRVVCRHSVNVTECLDELDANARASYVVSVTQRWWVADEYQIVVVSPVRRTTADVLCYLLLTLTAVNLVGVGGQLDCDEATRLLRRPSALAVGLFCRFAVMPAVSLHLKYI